MGSSGRVLIFFFSFFVVFCTGANYDYKDLSPDSKDGFFSVSHEEYLDITTKMMDANNVLIQSVLSRECKITVDFTGNGSFHMTTNPPLTPTSHLGLLCEVHKGLDSNGITLVTMVDKISYLHTKEAWLGFLNKAYFAIQNDRSFYIWIGNIPPESRPTFQSLRDTVPIRWFSCQERKTSLDGVHALKLLALLTLFEMPNPPSSALYIDSDMFISFSSQIRPFHVIEKNLEDPSIFMVGNVGGNADKHRSKLMNAGFIAAKNSIEAKRFLGLWWQSICGFHDQLPLYLSMMAYYSSISDFKFSVKELKLVHYGLAWKGARPYYYVEEHINEIREGPHCINSKRKLIELDRPTKLIENNPLCGIVVVHVSNDGFCHCHIKQCSGICKNIWPPPYEGAPLGAGRELTPLPWVL